VVLLSRRDGVQDAAQHDGCNAAGNALWPDMQRRNGARWESAILWQFYPLARYSGEGGGEGQFNVLKGPHPRGLRPACPLPEYRARGKMGDLRVVHRTDPLHGRAMHAHLNLGLRHILPVYPFLFIFSVLPWLRPGGAPPLHHCDNRRDFPGSRT